MAKHVAFEWDDRELRLVTASPRGDGISIDNMRIIALEDFRSESADDGDDSPKKKPPSKDVPVELAAALSSAGVGKCDALAVINRAKVELKQLSLPAVPDDELPDIVRFQAMREFSKLTEDWPLDFLTLAKESAEDAHEESLPVLAAAIPPELMPALEDAADKASLNITRAVLRPCSSASLFLRRPESRDHKLVVLVDIEDKEADITVLHGNDPVLLRTARLAHDVLAEGASAGSLLGEIRRTLPAAHSLVRGERVSGIFLSGATPGHVRVAETIQSTLEIPCSTYDPFSEVELGRKAASDAPNPAVFAPLIGALLDEVQGTGKHAFDFLNPRRPAAAPDQKRKMAVYGIAAAAVFVLGLVAYFAYGWKLDGELADLTSQRIEEENKAKPLADVSFLHGNILAWDQGKIDLLKEIQELSADYGDPTDVRLNRLLFEVREEKGSEFNGKLSLWGNASERLANVDASAGQSGPRLYAQLEDERHEVKPAHLAPDPDNPRLPRKFDFFIDMRKHANAPRGN